MSAPTSSVGMNVGPQPTVREGASRKARVIGMPVWREMRWKPDFQ